MKKWTLSAWDSNPGQQDGRRKQIHWAMAATKARLFLNDRAGDLLDKIFLRLKVAGIIVRSQYLAVSFVGKVEGSNPAT